MSKLTAKKKIEEIAKNFLKKQQSYKNINTLNNINKNKNEEFFSQKNKGKHKGGGEETIKDSISLAKTKNRNIIPNRDIKPIKANDSISNKPNINNNNSSDNLKFYSSVNSSLTDYYYCCKKNMEIKNCQIEDEKNINNNINNDFENKNIVSNRQKLQNKNKEEYKNLENKNLSLNSLISDKDNSIIHQNNLDDLNIINIIYKELLNDFSTTNVKDKNDYHKTIILSCEYFKYLFSNKIFIFIKYFNYSIEVNKFFFYEIYTFLTLIYIDENKDLNECSEMGYRTILLYLSQNYEFLLNIMEKVINPSEPKNYKSFKSRNKIIVSILKTLMPKKKIRNNSIHNYNNNEFPSAFNNNELLSFDLLKEIENEAKLAHTTEIKNSIFKKLKKFLSTINSNNNLINKILKNEDKNEFENIIKKHNNLKKNEIEKKYFSLPDFEGGKFKYSLFIELDETLVHYYEEGNNYFVKVRCGAEEFIKTMSEFCEIIIVSTSSKEYTDVIIMNINKGQNYVSQTIYKELIDNDNKILDLNKINRDIKKCIFICHTNQFFNAPKNNIVKLSEFLGEESDKEIIYLELELMKLIINNVDDVSTIIKDLLKFIENKKEEK